MMAVTPLRTKLFGNLIINNIYGFFYRNRQLFFYYWSCAMSTAFLKKKLNRVRDYVIFFLIFFLSRLLYALDDNLKAAHACMRVSLPEIVAGNLFLSGGVCDRLG